MSQIGTTIQFERAKNYLNASGDIIPRIANSKPEYGEPVFLKDLGILLIGQYKPAEEGIAPDLYTIQELIDNKMYWADAGDSTFENITLTGDTNIYGIARYHRDWENNYSSNDDELANTEFVQGAIYRARVLFISDDAPSYNAPGGYEDSDYPALWINTSDNKMYYKIRPTDAEWKVYNIVLPTGTKVESSPEFNELYDNTIATTEYVNNYWNHKRQVYYQSTDPKSEEGEYVQPGDIWDSGRRLKVWDGTKWDDYLNDTYLTGNPTTDTKSTDSTGKGLATLDFVHNVVKANKEIYFQKTAPDFAGMTSEEKKQPILWINSDNGIMQVWNGTAWKYVYSVWGTPK